jgi:hypothetical protein
MPNRAALLLPDEIIVMQNITGFRDGTESPGQGIFGVQAKMVSDEGIDQAGTWSVVSFLLSIVYPK